MANEITAQQLEDALGHLCDMMSEADMLQQAKGGAGLVLANGVCDAGGNFLFSSEVVFKYAKDEYGKEHITAEVAGKIVEDLIFDYGIKQTVKATLATVATVTVDTENPIGGGIAGVFAFGAGYTLTKATAVGGGALTTKLLEKVLIPSNTKKIESVEGNDTVLNYNSTTKKATISENSDIKALTNLALKKTDAQQLTIGTRTLDIRNLSPIELRNAVSHIDKVSFLLSEIKINVGEKLDMGSYGIYTVKSGDTLSEIAASHGMVTKDLVMLNTWLVDDGRIKFNYPTKVLIDAGTTISSGINHSMAGSGQDDVLIDHNGGNDTLVGYGGADYMDGGQGYDKYIAGNGDTIMDSDRLGVVLFEGTRLTKGIAQQGECSPDGDGTYKGDGGVYTLSNGTLTFKKNSGEILTIQKFVNGALGIVLTSENPGSSCPPPPPPASGLGTPTPNFSSPLVLDLNGDGVTSTFISDTTTYFDLDNDGVRQRTGWVQSDDALLVFDKNQDGKINNGTELFGNHTTLKNGTKAANGFEALREYDENKDGVIDAKDNIYNALKLWQDSNSDGITNTGELHTLSELGVESINLGYTQTTDYEEQNRIFQTSTFTTTTGETEVINDVWFATESRDTAREVVTLKDTVAALPDYRGAGRAENLSTAMNSNTKLEIAVTSLLSKATTATYSSLLTDVKNILALWTKTDNISATTTRGEQYILNHNYGYAQPVYRYHIYAYARDVAILETFWGQNFTMNVEGKTTSNVIGTEMSAYMTNAINSLMDTVLATLLVQQLYGKDAYDVAQGQFDYTGLFGNKINPVNSIIKSQKKVA